ncbi:hypothetical protein Glove_261g75 [Diversispora epigaea]|uniref:ENTH domain-containing protein n=1 Tax=Diversispora epigaea TaxID=1348612 RepID=A0A397IDK1_9GLOM|nr:hypothetical protein Glove_261g75 [Diversispora epigaea]
MSKKYMAKDAVRSIKNYTKGYSETQAKVRSATSNNPWGPSGSAMYEIAQATYNPHHFIEIMEMIDKRLNDHGKNWRHVFKALTLLHYCLNEGSPDVVAYAKENIYIVKTLQEFQYIDEQSKDQGIVVRQKAKEITNLLLDEDRLNSERRQRTDMRNRMTGRGDLYGGSIDRSLSSTPTYENSSYYDDEEAEIRRAMEESLKTAENEKRKESNEDDAEFQKALKLSKEEEERRQAELTKQNENLLFDVGNQFSQNQTQPQPQSQSQVDFFGNPINANQQFSAQYVGTSSPPFDTFDLDQNNFINQKNSYNLLQQQQLQQQQLLLQQQQLQQQHQQQQLLNNPYQQQQTSIVGSKNPFAQQSQQNNFTTTSYSSSHLPTFGNSFTSNLSSPDLSAPMSDPIFSSSKSQSPEPKDEKHSKLASLIGNRGDGMDTFGNIGNLRVPTGTGFANSDNLAQSLRRSNSAGNLPGTANSANPFLADTSSANNVGSGAYNTFPSSFQSTGLTKDDLFSTFGTTNTHSSNINQPPNSFSSSPFSVSNNVATSNSLIDLDGGGFVGSQPSKNPFQTLNNTSISNSNKPKTLNDLGRESQFNQQSQQQTLNTYNLPNQPGFWS